MLIFGLIMAYIVAGLIANRLVIGNDDEVFTPKDEVNGEAIGFWLLILLCWPLAAVFGVFWALWWVSMPVYRNKIRAEKRQKAHELQEAVERAHRAELVAAENIIDLDPSLRIYSNSEVDLRSDKD